MVKSVNVEYMKQKFLHYVFWAIKIRYDDNDKVMTKCKCELKFGKKLWINKCSNSLCVKCV